MYKDDHNKLNRLNEMTERSEKKKKCMRCICICDDAIYVSVTTRATYA